jgi:PAS domain S-box-containing protein
MIDVAKYEKLLAENEDLKRQLLQKNNLENEINYSAERYQGLMTNLCAGVVVHASDTSIVMNNQIASELLGLSDEQLKGKTAIDPAWHFLDENGKIMSVENYPVNLIIKNRKPINNYIVGVFRPNKNDKVWLTVNGFPVINENNEIIEIVISFVDFTAHKRLENELITAKEKAEESEEKYRLLYENAGIGIGYWSPNGIVLSYNQIAAKYMNGIPEDFIGKSIFDLFPESLAEIYFARIKEAVNSTKLSVYEDFVQLPAGNKWFLSTYSKIENLQKKVLGIQIISQDITLLKNSEQDLQKAKEKVEESEEKLRHFLDTISEGVSLNELIFNENGIAIDYKVIDANSYYYKIMRNALPEQIIGQKATLLYGMKTENITAFWEMHKTLKTTHYSEYPTDDGKWYFVSTSPIEENKFVTAFFDITERKNSEIELAKAKEKAEESNRLKTAFLQNMSHEIRTPLNAISGFSGLLDKSEISEEKRKSFVSIIQNSSNQLISIVTDILTISSLETKQEKVNVSSVCINTIIVELLAIFKQQAQNQNISLYAKQQLSDKQSEIYTDKTKLTQILTNLISNALKFTHEGFIEFGYNLKENEFEFYVKDSGIGIKQEFHNIIFERFRQADKSINKIYGGTGLGLAISKAFVELLGGKIWVQSEIEKGSIFYFTIPYKPVREIDKSLSAIQQNEIFKTILVVEDEEFNFLYIEELLIDMDLKLIHAKDGLEAVEICKKNPTIELILMDIKLPILSGDEAAKLIKEFRPNLPIIAQSAYALEHERAKYEEIFDDYLVKPIRENDLKKIVQKKLY